MGRMTHCTLENRLLTIEYRTRNRRRSKDLLDFALRHSLFDIQKNPFVQGVVRPMVLALNPLHKREKRPQHRLRRFHLRVVADAVEDHHVGVWDDLPIAGHHLRTRDRVERAVDEA